MHPSKNWRHLAVVATCLTCATLLGCSSVQPVTYSGIASAPYLKPNPQNTSGKIPYSYTTAVDWKKYSKIIIDPVAVYFGPDNQFGDMHDKDKEAIAAYMQSTFKEKLATRFDIVNTPAPDTLRLKLTLTGAETTTPVLGTLSHFDIAGGIYNGIQSVRGGKGTFTGSVIYAVEIYDASTNRLLNAYVTKQYPNAMNIGASFGSLHASRTGVDKGADALVTQFR